MEIINLDMVPGKKSPVCHASQYDDGRVIRFNLYDSGLPFTLDGNETITFEVRKPDGNIVTSTLTNTSDSYVDVVTTEQMTAVKGANLCEVRVEKGATNIGSLNVIMAVEMDPTDGGIASASEIDNLRSQISGMVAEEVAEQYDAGSVIFDSAPTPGHGNGYAVTSEGVNNALAPKADRSELPDMSNYYTKSETDTALGDKVNTSDFEATNLPISSSDPTNTKDYIDFIKPQRYRYVGQFLDSNGGTIKGCGEAIITLQNGIARIDFGLMIETADEVSNEVWGINSDFFTPIVGKTITPSYGGVATFYAADGAIFSGRHGYCGNFGTLANPYGNYWKPARIYKSGSNYNTGTWASGTFGVGQRIIGTCWGTYS